MLSSLLLLFAAQPQTSTNYVLDGIQNGTFQHLSTDGILGTSTTRHADGGYWCGAEGRTVLTGANRYLQFQAGEEAFVSQRVPVMRGHEPSPSVGAKVRLRSTGQEARITVAEGQSLHDSIYTAMNTAPSNACSTPPCVPGTLSAAMARWEFWEKHAWPGGSGTPTWKAMPVTFVGGNAYEARGANASVAACLGNGEFTRNVVGAETVVVSTQKLVVTWVAPQSGWVRAVGRPYRIGGYANDGVTCSVFLDGTNAAGTAPPDTLGANDRLLGIAPLVAADVNGPELLARLFVTQGQRLHFEIDTPTANGICGESFWLDWAPSVFYEGKKLTYRIGSGLSSIPNTADEVFQIVPFTQPLNNWQVFTLPAGVDFRTAWCTGGGACAHPWGALDLVLNVPASNTAATDFDNIQCNTELETLTESQLRSAIRSQMDWIAGNYRMVREAPPNLPPLGPINRASPYEVHTLKIKNGPVAATPPVTEGGEPHYIGSALGFGYRTDDYEALSWLTHTSLRQTVPGSGGELLLAGSYDPTADQFSVPPRSNMPFSAGNVSVGAVYGTWPDVTVLDRMYDAATLVAAHGVLNDTAHASDPRNGLILGEGYQINPEINTQAGDVTQLAGPTAFMSGTLALIDAYVNCRAYNAAHVGTPRYPPARLAIWLGKIRTAVDVLRTMKGFVGGPVAWNASDPVCRWNVWTDNWHSIGGEGSDYYGYRGGDAIGAYEGLHSLQLVPGGSTSTEDQLALDVWNDLIVEPADHFIGLFEQAISRNATLPGDNARMWAKYQYLVLKNAPNAPRYRDQLVAAALHALKFQYAGATHPTATTTASEGGIWTAGIHVAYQVLDTTDYPFASRTKAACSYFMGGMGMALSCVTPGSTDRSNLDAAVYSVFHTSELFFRKAYGYVPHVDDNLNLDWVEKATPLVTDQMLSIEPFLDPSAPPPTDTPAVTITPVSLLASPPTPTPFTVRVHFPEVLGNPNAATLLAQLAQNNVRVRRWRDHPQMGSAPAVWASDDLWGPASAPVGPGPLVSSICLVPPGTPVNWNVIVQPSGLQDVVDLQMSSGLAQQLCLQSGTGDFKIEAWAWPSSNLHWRADISTQSW